MAQKLLILRIPHDKEPRTVFEGCYPDVIAVLFGFGRVRSMQKKITISAFLLLIILPLKTFSETIPAVTITEIAAFEASDTEWVEIFNQSGSTTDLTGWKFFEDGANHGISVFRGDAVLDPGEYAIIANKGDLLAQKYAEYTGTIFDSSWGSLKEEGEEIGLKDADSNFAEVFTYAANTSGTSLQKNADGTWTAHPTSHSMGTSSAAVLTPSTEQETGTSSEAIPLETGTTTEASPSPPTSTPIPAIPANAPNPAPNSPPQAVIQIQSGSLTAYETTSINFDGRSSLDPNGDPLTYVWDLGDGTMETTPNPPTHKYAQPGTYAITLTVMDPAGARGTAQQFVNVLRRPVLTAEAPQTTAAQPVSPPPPPTAPSAAPTAASTKSPAAPAEQLAQSGQPAFNFAPFELKGYFLFVPAGTVQAPAKKKPAKKTAPKSKSAAKPAKPKKTTAPKAKKTQKKSTAEAGQNGDLSNALRITEIFPAPADDEEEWIEIWNGGDTPVNLGNWMLSDSGKTTSPHKIPDSVTLDPNQYAVFPKSETKISLNNSKDTVTLLDFQGLAADRITYEKTEKGKSYALLKIEKERPRSAGTAYANAEEEVWEWMAPPTPALPNPRLLALQGKVTRLLADGGPTGGRENAPENSAIEMETENGEEKTVHFSQDQLDPTIANLVLQEGSILRLQAKEEAGGMLSLQKIQEVEPPPQKETKKIPLVLWLAAVLVGVGVIINLIPLISRMRKRGSL